MMMIISECNEDYNEMNENNSELDEMNLIYAVPENFIKMTDMGRWWVIKQTFVL